MNSDLSLLEVFEEPEALTEIAVIGIGNVAALAINYLYKVKIFES